MNSPADNLQSMLCIQPISPQSNIDSIEDSIIQALAAYNAAPRSADRASFLRYVEEYGQRVAQDFAADIDHLQEIFLGAVHQAFQLAGITVDSRLIISLNQQGNLHVEIACADQEQIGKLLSSSRALPALFKLLSVQSAILGGITNLCLAAKAQDKGDSEKLSQLQQSYRVCLKGQLSHFYSA